MFIFFKKKKVLFFQTSDFCIHEKLWKKYIDITNISFQLCKKLNKILFNLDKRFKSLNWSIFDDLHYPIKICYDTFYYNSELIAELLHKYNPTEFIISDSKDIELDEFCEISKESNVFGYLLSNLNENIKITKIKKGSNLSYDFDSKYKLTKKKNLTNFNNFKKKLFSFFHKLNFNFKILFKKYKYLSIGCYEVKALKQLHPNLSKDFVAYYYEKKIINKSLKKNYLLEKFKKAIKEDSEFQKILFYKNSKFEKILDLILTNIINSLNYYLNEYENAKKIVKKINPKSVIFQSMAPLYLPNVIFRKVCNELNIPFVTWVHGGYFTKSLGGFDVVDYRFCKMHISYGQYLKDLIDSKKSSLELFKFKENHKIFPIGSFRFSLDLRKNDIKKFNINISNNSKKNILFAAGCYIRNNQFYFGYNRKKAETSLWEQHFEIIKILSKYKKKYNIIFKDYPYGHTSLWKQVLKDLDSEQITYISKESSISNLLKQSDLNIFPWMSTTFFESLNYKSDIFLLEEDLFIDPFIKNFNDEIYWFSNFEKFKINLDLYLDYGEFFKKTKKNSQNYFLNSNINEIEKINNLRNILENIPDANNVKSVI